MDQGVEADDRIKGCRWQPHLHGVSALEAGGRHEATGPVDLHLTDVDAGHAVPSVGEEPSDGDPAAAAQIQHGRRGGQPLMQVGEPWSVLTVLGVVAPVVIRELVVPTTDEIPLVVIAAHDRTGSQISMALRDGRPWSGRRSRSRRTAVFECEIWAPIGGDMGVRTHVCRGRGHLASAMSGIRP